METALNGQPICHECGDTFNPDDSNARAFATFCSRECERASFDAWLGVIDPNKGTGPDIETFDIDAMEKLRGLAHFRPGQRISADIARLLNGLPEALAALRAYQTASGVAEFTRFGPEPPAATEPPKHPNWRRFMSDDEKAILNAEQAKKLIGE